MKKILSLLIVSTLLVSIVRVIPNSVYAQTIGTNTTEEQSGVPAVTDELLDSFDPLKTAGSPHAETFSTPGGIISRLLQFAFPLAGMILFVMIVVGGFQILSGGGSPEGMKAGQERVTMAIVGFLLLFASYWIAQLLEEILNIKIL